MYKNLFGFVASIIIIPIFVYSTDFTFAQTEIQKLQNQISEYNNNLSTINTEIQKYESLLQTVSSEKKTLQNTVNRFNLERKKVLANLNYTNSEIDSTDLTISILTLEIQKSETKIEYQKDAVAKILRKFHVADNESFVEILLQNPNISQFWTEFEELSRIKENINSNITELKSSNEILTSKREQNNTQKHTLINLKDQYQDQQTVLTHNRDGKAKLLSVTQNEESNFQSLLRKKQDAKANILAQMREIESEIEFILDPNTIPRKGSAVFTWPLSNPRITQYFGYTRFALSGAYGGSMHNGIDLGAPVGTKARAPLTGVVRAIGNTDLVPGCYSWGKWLLIDHANGLSSMFAHLSHISVTPGQKVTTGEIVGYVGNTGFSTGPHLHFTVYVTRGVQVRQFNQFRQSTSCGAASSPFAAVEAHLNPLDYLPVL